MAEEMSSITCNEKWELVDRLTEKKFIELKWIYKTKFKVNGDILKHKARIIAKG